MKYILVTGGVISGIGKGVIASSVGTILKHCGLRVTSIKIDPYINIDAGTFSPYEHGEVFVLDDGGEVDLDLGNYERFLDVTLHRDNNITTGKIYQSVVPHITDAIQEWVESVAQRPVDGDLADPEVCIIELGGTIGDIEGMPFVEAFRQFQFRVKRENFCVVHVSLVPQPSSTGEHKTKPTQASVRELRGLGLSPDFIVCRSEMPIDQSVKHKISNFCHVSPEQVICLHDAQSIYEVPLMLEEQQVSHLLSDRLSLNLDTHRPRNFMKKWRDLSIKHEHLRNTVTIALVGKYTQLEDSYASVIKALQHAALACNRKLDLKCMEAEDLEEEAKNTRAVKYYESWQNVCKCHGIIVPGGFGQRGVEGKVAVCKWARMNKKPFLGVCLGLQAAVIEFARYEVDPKMACDFESAGLKFVGQDVEGERMEIMELDHHPYYVACQYHPEYLTRPLKPSPPYLGLILASCGKLEQYLARGCRMSPTDSPESSDEELPMPPHLLVNQTDKPSMSPARRTPPPSSSQKSASNLCESLSPSCSTPKKRNTVDAGFQTHDQEAE
ncbi:CTP synthase-like [Homarus americanus]|uniref:CTP synthase n=1 Tax=Homarus americanus TaxID=6706 RepID=A0A8J5JY51_HOMAM|nr:CTP synthase-like [Homarus americanus]